MKSKDIQTKIGKRRRDFVNKFLSKTYHMINGADPAIASWSNGGESFTINDVDAFEKDILPKYFSHNHFTSFTRQLNFYGFSKERSDPDLQTQTTAIRFSHEFFRQGQPEILHMIRRSTAPDQPPKLEELQEQVRDLKNQMAEMKSGLETRMQEEIKALEHAYLMRLSSLQQSYENLLTTTLQFRDDLVRKGLSSYMLFRQPNMLTPVMIPSTMDNGFHSLKDQLHS